MPLSWNNSNNNKSTTWWHGPRWESISFFKVFKCKIDAQVTDNSCFEQQRGLVHFSKLFPTHESQSCWERRGCVPIPVWGTSPDVQLCQCFQHCLLLCSWLCLLLVTVHQLGWLAIDIGKKQTKNMQPWLFRSKGSIRKINVGFIFSMFTYLFWDVGKGQREREKESQRGSTLSAEPNAGLDLRNCEIMIWAESRARCLTDWAAQVPLDVRF